MTIEIWLAFVVATIILLMIPGPTILTVISYSLSHGTRARVPLVAAVALGDSTALVLSLLGLGALLASSAAWFIAVKWIGGLYLLYLGIKLLRSGISPVQLTANGSQDSPWQVFANTWMVTSLNPKGIVFFVAFLPQFVDPAGAVAQQLWILSVTFVCLAAINAMAYAIFALSARRVLQSDGAQRGFNLTGGSLLSAAGLWALTARQPG